MLGISTSESFMKMSRLSVQLANSAFRYFSEVAESICVLLSVLLISVKHVLPMEVFKNELTCDILGTS